MTAVGNGPVDTIDEAYPCAGAAAICMGIWEGRLGFVPGNSIGAMDLSPLTLGLDCIATVWEMFQICNLQINYII